MIGERERAVSYTHLDVYKRQLYTMLGAHPFKFNLVLNGCYFIVARKKGRFKNPLEEFEIYGAYANLSSRDFVLNNQLSTSFTFD